MATLLDQQRRFSLSPRRVSPQGIQMAFDDEGGPRKFSSDKADPRFSAGIVPSPFNFMLGDLHIRLERD